MEQGLALAAGLPAAILVCAAVVWWSPRWGLAATSVLGLLSSAYLFSRKLDSTGESLCNVNAVVNCDAVNNSAASELMGIPIALLGAGFFLGVAVAAAFGGAPRQRLFQVVTWLAAGGVAYSIYLAFAALQIGAVCVLCMTIYACCGLLVWGGWLGARREGAGLADAPAQVAISAPALVVLFVFLGVVLVGQSAWSSARARTTSGRAIEALQASDEGERPTGERLPLDEVIASLYARPSNTAVLEGDEPRLGREDAPYTIVEFADFGCPHCAEACETLHDLVEQVPQVQVRFRSFPLSGLCNPLFPASGGSELEIGRCRAALASSCAGSQGKFWEYSREVFAGQPDLSDERLVDIAKQVGLDMDSLQTCMADPATLKEITKDAEAGGALRLQGTPAFFALGFTADPGPVEVCGGVGGVMAMLQAKARGMELAPPSQASCPN
jgi:protein-disulfide isomerase/uncharacterized membrane protein